MPISQDILAQFNQLERSGALDALGDLRRENRELERIINDAALLLAYTDVNSMLDFFIAKILDHFIPQFLGFLVLPPRGKKIRQYCYRNLKESPERIEQLYWEILKERFNHNPAPADFSELSDELGADVFTEEFRGLKPEVIFPMYGIGGLYGVVILGSKIVGEGYSELEKKYVDRMIRFLSVSVQNGLHYESSITDPKTGLFTHDYFIRRLDEAVSHARRRKSPAGVLMLDVDHFKRFNDTWGHVTGDEVLLAIAEQLKVQVRGEDCAARFGGEEFTVLLSGCDAEKLMLVSERIREAISLLQVPAPDGSGPLSVTVSLGARLIKPAAGSTSVSLLEEADKALYRSKAGGRNRSTLFCEGLLERAEHVRGANSPLS